MKGTNFKKALITNAVLALVFTISAMPAATTPPDAVTIVSYMVIPPSGFAYGTFEASGPAVQAGILCPAGDVFDTNYRVAGGQNKKFSNLFVHKQFVCDDGSGTFEMDLNVRLISGSRVNWRVTGGDGAYVQLRGQGMLTGQAQPNGTLLDLYKGKMFSG